MLPADIQGIYEETKRRVDERLTRLDREVNETFDEGAEEAIGARIIETAIDRRGEGIEGIDEFRQAIDQLTGRLDDLEGRYEQDIERLTRRLTQVEHYVMERSVLCKCSSFASVADRFDSDIAQEIVEISEEFLDQFGPEDRIDPGEYFDFISQVIELERGLLDQLQGRIDERSFERFAKTVDALQIAFEPSCQLLEVTMKSYHLLSRIFIERRQFLGLVIGAVAAGCPGRQAQDEDPVTGTPEDKNDGRGSDRHVADDERFRFRVRLGPVRSIGERFAGSKTDKWTQYARSHADSAAGRRSMYDGRRGVRGEG